MANWRIDRVKSFLIKKLENIFFSSKTKHVNHDILLIKLDKLGDYILFRNFIEEIYKNKNDEDRLVLCGNVIWKELAERLDGRYVNKFIWVDIPLLENWRYRFSIYRKLRSTRCSKVIHCAYSRTLQGDNLAIHSGGMEIIGYDGDEINTLAETKKENDIKYTMLVPSSGQCIFEFYRNKLLFEYIFKTNIEINAPTIKLPLTKEGEQYIVLFPGAGHEIKRWSTFNFAVFCKALYQLYHIPILICGSVNENVYAEEIIAQAGEFVKNCIGKYSLYETIEVVQKAYLVVANDSGPLHIAMAFKRPAVCIFNGNLFKRFCPYPEEMNMPLVVVFPDEFDAKIKEEKLEKSIRCQESSLDINLIKPEKVILALKNSNIINHG